MRGAPAEKLAWYSLGDTPTSSRNFELNEPRLEYPTSMQTSVTVRFVALEQVLRSLDAALGEVQSRRLAVRRGEATEEVVLRRTRLGRERVEVEWFGVVAIDEVASTPQVDEKRLGDAHSAGSCQDGVGDLR